LVAVG